jgi:hypothetical protein
VTLLISLSYWILIWSNCNQHGKFERNPLHRSFGSGRLERMKKVRFQSVDNSSKAELIVFILCMLIPIDFTGNLNVDA